MPGMLLSTFLGGVINTQGSVIPGFSRLVYQDLTANFLLFALPRHMRFPSSSQMAGVMIGDGQGNGFGEFYLSFPDEPVKIFRDVKDLELEIPAQQDRGA